MVKKLNISGDLREGFYLLSIVSNLADYRISFFINSQLGIRLKKYADFIFEPEKTSHSWFYFFDTHLHAYFYLFANKSGGNYLIPELKQFDYLLLIKGDLPLGFYQDKAAKLRQVPNVQAVFHQSLQQLKNTDVLLELLEMHELRQLVIPFRPKNYRTKKS